MNLYAPFERLYKAINECTDYSYPTVEERGMAHLDKKCRCFNKVDKNIDNEMLNLIPLDNE